MDEVLLSFIGMEIKPRAEAFSALLCDCKQNGYDCTESYSLPYAMAMGSGSARPRRSSSLYCVSISL